MAVALGGPRGLGARRWSQGSRKGAPRGSRVVPRGLKMTQGHLQHCNKIIIHFKLSPPVGYIAGETMEVEAVRSMSWEGCRGVIAGEAMEVEVIRSMSWQGGRGDITGEAVEVEAARRMSWEGSVGICRGCV